MIKDYEHQRRIVDQTWRYQGWNLFCDTGTGKTRIALKTCERMRAAGLINGLLVLAPAGMYRNWLEQISLHSTISPTDVFLWSSTLSSSKRDSLAMQLHQPHFRVLLMNIEAIRSAESDAFRLAQSFIKARLCLMVVDESTKIRKPDSQTTKNVLILGRHAAYRRNLSGFPAPERPVDLFTQCLFIRPPSALFPFKSWYAFRNTFCVVEQDAIYVRGGRLQRIARIVGAQRQSELRELLLNFSTLLSKKECLDLPPKVYLSRDVEMTKEQSALYKEAQEKALFALTQPATTATASGSAPVVSVSNRMAQLEKLHQIENGLVRDEAGNWHLLPTRIYDELFDQLEEIRGKVVIYSAYTAQIKETVRRLNAAYGDGCAVAFFGETPAGERAGIVAQYEDPASSVRYLVTNPATSSFGWTLVAGSTAIYLSSTHEVEPRHQSEDRLHRIGQNAEAVTYIDFITGPIGRRILDNVRNKRSTAAEIMGPGWEELLYGKR